MVTKMRGALVYDAEAWRLVAPGLGRPRGAHQRIAARELSDAAYRTVQAYEVAVLQGSAALQALSEAYDTCLLPARKRHDNCCAAMDTEVRWASFRILSELIAGPGIGRVWIYEALRERWLGGEGKDW